MSQIDIKDLFDENRFPSGLQLVSLIAYTPVGIILVLLRLLISLQIWLAAVLIPNNNTLRGFLHRGLRLAFGIVVQVKPSEETKDEKTRIVIANCVSTFDHLVLRRALGTVTPSVWDLPDALSNAFGLERMDMSSKDSLVLNIKTLLTRTTSNVALQPEISSTNGRVALLKFNSWPFSIEPVVLPVAIEARRPEIANVKLTSVASTWWTDVFWFMFVPYTVFTIKCLKIKRNADHEILTREVEKDIAVALNLKTSSHTVTDKTEYEKRYVMDDWRNDRRTINRNVTTTAPSAEMQHMAIQVREVLPLVPYSVIIRDLLKTRNVDVTIANLLDGIVNYTPEPVPSSANTATVSSNASPMPSSSRGNTSIGNLSFQERKAKLISEARERYIKKNGLTNC